VVKPRYKRHVQTVDLTGAVDVKTIRVDLLLHIEPAPAGGVDSAGLFQKANATLKSGRLAEAIRLYKAAVARSPQHREAWYNLGIAYSRAKQFEKEIAAYKEAIRVSATLYTKAMFNLAIAYEDQGQESRALALYEKVSAAEPGSVDARINLGILYARLRRYDDAIRSYRAAITREPDSRDAHFNLGIAYGRKAAQVSNKAEKAAFLRKEIAAYSKAVRIDFRHHKAWYNLAIAHHKLGHHKDEIIAYERAIQAKSDYPQALFNLAAAHQEQGAARKALGVWRSYLKVAQADPGEDAFVKAARLQISKLEAKLGE
jgi:tetratricopeptide (TPR) repeat protein